MFSSVASRWRNLSLIVQLALGPGLVILIGSVALLFLVGRSVTDHEIGTSTREANDEMAIIGPIFQHYYNTNQQGEIQRVLKAHMQSSSFKRMTWIDENGTVIQHEQPSDYRRITWIDETGTEIRHERPSQPTHTPDWFVNWVGYPDVIRSYSVKIGDRVGVIRVEMSKTHHLDSLWDLFTIWVVMLGGVIVAFMLAIIGTVHTSLLPLRLLTQASVSVGEGNYNATLPVVGISEVRPTIQAFNSMVVNLRLLTGHLSDVVNHIEEAKEEQNRTIARELHDNLGGTLTMIKMGIDSLNEDLSADEYTHEKLESLMEMAGSAIRMTRAITQGLRPPMLDTLGFGPTIEWYVGEFSRMSNIECLVHVSVGIHLSELMTIGLLRIVQEGLNNIAKHAEATYVSVLATSEAPGELTLMISDNGKGVEDRPSKSISSGLLGMRERIHRMGGTFLLNRATGSIGTSILIKVPTA